MTVTPRRSNVVLAAQALAFAVLAAGCTSSNTPDGKPDSGKSCQTDTDCPSNDMCVGGLCLPQVVVSCADGGECPEGFTCNELTTDCEAVDAGTEPDSGMMMIGTDAAQGGSCTSKYMCAFGQACTNGMCTDTAPSTCSTDDQCPVGETCSFSHTCSAGCETNQDCQAPQTCSGTLFMCVSPAGADAGTDAGMVINPVDGGPNCTTDNCNGVNCSNIPATCDPTTCTCQQANCSATNCGGVPCSTGQTCQNCNTCVGGSSGGDGGIGGSSCTDSSQCPGPNAYCATLLGMSGTCTTSCTTSADCSAGVMCCSAAILGIAACCDIDGLASSAGGLATCM